MPRQAPCGCNSICSSTARFGRPGKSRHSLQLLPYVVLPPFPLNSKGCRLAPSHFTSLPFLKLRKHTRAPRQNPQDRASEPEAQDPMLRGCHEPWGRWFFLLRIRGPAACPPPSAEARRPAVEDLGGGSGENQDPGSEVWRRPSAFISNRSQVVV